MLPVTRPKERTGADVKGDIQRVPCGNRALGAMTSKLGFSRFQIQQMRSLLRRCKFQEQLSYYTEPSSFQASYTGHLHTYHPQTTREVRHIHMELVPSFAVLRASILLRRLTA